MIKFMNKTDKVVTVSGKEANRNDCIYYKKNEEYYEKNIDCFKIKDDSPKGERWYRLNSGKIGYNIETKTHDLITNLKNDINLIEGIVDSSGNKGFFLRKRDYIIGYEYYENKIPLPIIDLKTAESLGYISCLWDDVYYRKENLNKDQLHIISSPRVRRYKNYQFNYSANDTNNSYKQIKKEYEKAGMEIHERTKLIEKFLYNTSFGIEFESSNGTIKESELGKLGLVPLKDGSLRKGDGTEPYEYTTVPLFGSKGLETVKLICEALNKYCEFDSTCSMHVHIGNIKYDRTTILAYYILWQRIQDEIYDCFPMYKRDEIKYAGKQKNYNQPLPQIGLLTNRLYRREYKNPGDFNAHVQEHFNRVFEFLTSGALTKEDSSYNLEKGVHPQGHTKWSIASRYFGCNFNSLVFSQQRTLEFRIHPGTFSFTKTANWLFFCIAFVTYAQRHTEAVITGKLKPTINDILDGFATHFDNKNIPSKIGTQFSEYLKGYFDFRKEKMKEANDKEDWLGTNLDFEGEKAFTFKSHDLDNLY